MDSSVEDKHLKVNELKAANQRKKVGRKNKNTKGKVDDQEDSLSGKYN